MITASSINIAENSYERSTLYWNDMPMREGGNTTKSAWFIQFKKSSSMLNKKNQADKISYNTPSYVYREGEKVPQKFKRKTKKKWNGYKSVAIYEENNFSKMYTLKLTVSEGRKERERERTAIGQAAKLPSCIIHIRNMVYQCTLKRPFSSHLNQVFRLEFLNAIIIH